MVLLPAVVAEEEQRPSKRATQMPADYRPKPSHFALAASLGVNLQVEGPRFVDHHLAKGSKFKDWDRALNTWIRNAGTDFGRRATVHPIRPDAPPPGRYDSLNAQVGW